MNLFSDLKATEVAAYFLTKSDGQLPVLKLMKLMYLAERESFKKNHLPIIGDLLVSMPHGPVLSLTYDRLNGNCRNTYMSELLSDKENYNISLKKDICIDSDLKYLNYDEVKVLESVWNEFGHMGKWEIRDYTHNGGCPEWTDPNGSSVPISYKELFKALDFDDDTASSIEEYLNEEVEIDDFFASLT
ncbi:Panacea domain-containing protein [Acinetobacter lanii]|uniref:SocA family protein n=1 Tax=Acinetobacter lanii TaxID=2715163 RepID=A0A6G8S7C8_9GAMM|nr:Panacea domain-containing protein [Acinetobacter lanii]QIO10024.1 SocA family protein [Acinetobacter lanii]